MAKYFRHLTRLFQHNSSPAQNQQHNTPTDYLMNPFTENPVADPLLFFGREDLLSVVQTLCITHRTCIITGERRLGKTSILLQLLNGRLGEECLPFYISMRHLATTISAHEFLVALNQIILKNSDLDAKSFDFPSNNPIVVADALLDAIHQQAPHKALVFLIDETGILLAKLQHPRSGRKVFAYLNHLAERPYLSFCFTGSRYLKEVMDTHWRKLISQAVFYEITYLDQPETQQLIQKSVTANISYAEGITETIYQLTGGHPYYTQLICKHSINYLNTLHLNHLTKEALETVINALLDTPPTQLLSTWDNYTVAQQTALILLGARCNTMGASSPTTDLFALAKTHSFSISLDIGSLSVTLGMLFSENLLGRTKTGSYYFRLDLWRRWIRQYHPVHSL